MPRISSSREHRRKSSSSGYNHLRRAALQARQAGSPMIRSSMDSYSTQSSWDSLRNYLLSPHQPSEQSFLPNHISSTARESTEAQFSLSRPPSLVYSETSVQTTSSESGPPHLLTAQDRYYALQRAALTNRPFPGPASPYGSNPISQGSYACGSSMPQQPFSCFSSSSGTSTSFLPQPHCEEESWGQFVEEIEPEEIPSFNYRKYQAILNRSGRAYYR